jgi:hypothetical protein
VVELASSVCHDGQRTVQVQEQGHLVVASFKEDEGRKQRPHGITTVELVKAASQSASTRRAISRIPAQSPQSTRL